jgi:FkbM family methyltransferase
LASWADALLARWYRSNPHPGKIRLLRLARTFLRKSTIVAPICGTVRMELDPSDYVQREILLHGAYEARTLRLLGQLLKSCDAFWDFGAHMGLYTLQAATQLAPRNKRVLAIEPNPAHCQALQRNLLLNRLNNVTLCTAACGDTASLTQLITPDSDNTGGSRLGAYSKPDSRHTNLVVSVLPAAELARAFGLNQSTLVKIDTEGLEFAILDSLLTQARPSNIIVEYFKSNHDSENIRARFEAYRKLGYVLKTVDGEIWDGVADLTDNNIWLSL